MIDYLNSIKSLVKVDKVHTDNNIFKLHYKFTVIILIFFSILLTSKQYFGDPIDCKVDVAEKSLVNTFCWTHGTYIMLDSLDMKNGVFSGLGTDVLSSSPYDQRYPSTRTNNRGFILQKYYQWVCLFFCFQALLFYIPRYLWKNWEAGRMRLLVKDLGGPVVTSNWNAENKMRIVNYLICRKYAHNVYALRFTLCELLNFLNVLFQIFLTDWFLSGYFIGYGISLVIPSEVNPMTLVFPKLAKCEYKFYGMSGSEHKTDALCLLPLNVVNEKLFIFLWFWFLVLTMLSFYQLMYRCCILMSRTFRERLLRASCRYLTQKTCDVIVDNFSFGDMFFLNLLAKNVNPIIYQELLAEIVNAVNDRTGSGYTEEVTVLA